MKEKLKLLFLLFITFAKIGLFTFGGGYAMIPLIQKETVEKRKWIKEGEILDILAIAESTPGPVSVNAATFIGYRKAGILGGILATLGLILPSFIIIFLISLIYKEVMTWTVVIAAFKGIKIAVILLLISAVIKLSKGCQKGKAFYIPFLLSLTALLCVSFFKVNIPFFSIGLIVLGLIYGICIVKFTSKEENK